MGIFTFIPSGRRPYATLPVITPVNVAAPPGVAIQIDTGVANRQAVSIHNLGDNGLWIAFTNAVAANNGEFIPGSPTAGAMLGGFWADEIGSAIPIWAISQGGANLVIVVEFVP